MGTTTTNYGFYKPAHSEAQSTWETAINTALDTADTAVAAAIALRAIGYGVLSSRPSVGTAGDKGLYLATDQNGGTLYQVESGAWVQITVELLHATRHAPGGTDALNYTLVHLVGTDSSKPAAASGNAGLLYYGTDTGILYRSDGSTWARINTVAMDFGNDYIDALAADGADMSIRCARNMTVNSGTIGFDANPAQTLTLTLQQRRAGSVIASATLTVSTSGVVTPAGFPIASILAGDRLRVNLAGTANVTGINYVFNARAES